MRDSNDTLTVLGVLGTDPEVKITASGLRYTRFRMASTQRKLDKSTNTWIDGNTNWYTVSAFRTLGVHAAATLHKGDPVVVTGRLRLRAWDTGEKQGLAVDLDADVIGLDLQWGTANYTRATHTRALTDTAPFVSAHDQQFAPVHESWASDEASDETPGSNDPVNIDALKQLEPTPF